MPQYPNDMPGVYYRLIALWVLCEAMLGGIIHGFRIPVSGLIVGSCAVICICLLAWYVPNKGAILKATIIVAIFKMMLSPQAPPPAYIAVFFQGLLGELLFWNRRNFRLCCILLGFFSLLESGLQRILVLTIIYGNDLWRVINEFLEKLTGNQGNSNYSLWIGVVYVGIHIIFGIMVGWWASSIPHKVEAWNNEKRFRIQLPLTTGTGIRTGQKRKRKWRRALLVVWLLLLALYIQSYFEIGNPLLPAHISLKILLRSIIIVLAWVFFISPLLKSIMQKWLQRKKKQSEPEIEKVFALLPSTIGLMRQSWELSLGNSGWKRIKEMMKCILVNSLFPLNDQGGIFILTGPIQTGKTTSLEKWIISQPDVRGILTPVIDGKRMFRDIETGQLFMMEAKENESEVWKIGKFVFSKVQFERAEKILLKAGNTNGWLVIDEVGPLELQEKGFLHVIKKLLAERKGPILLVVRDKDDMVNKVKQFFGLPGAKVIHSPEELYGMTKKNLEAP
jgi:nucleoside-triphosphatase THEP1